MAELEQVARQFMAAFDRMEFQKVSSMTSDDAQGVDELSRKWLRGRKGIDDYFRQFGPMMSDITSNMSDFHENVWGDTGLVTCWMEQDYNLQGQPQHFSGPMTLVLRRQGNEWKVALVHAVPLPEATA